MKRILFLICMFPFISNAEVFHCENLKGYSVGSVSTGKSFKEKLCDSPQKAELIYKNGCSYYVNEEDMTIVCDNEPVDKCPVIKNTSEETVIVCGGTVATGVYLISKKEHKIFYSKVGNIHGGYAMMFEANCK